MPNLFDTLRNLATQAKQLARVGKGVSDNVKEVVAGVKLIETAPVTIEAVDNDYSRNEAQSTS